MRMRRKRRERLMEVIVAEENISRKEGRKEGRVEEGVRMRVCVKERREKEWKRQREKKRKWNKSRPLIH